MKLIVDKMPTTANECLFSAMGTGKPRCRHDAKLCPLLRGEECPHLMTADAPHIDPEMIETLIEKRMKVTAQGIEIDSTLSIPKNEPKKRLSKRSTAKKAD